MAQIKAEDTGVAPANRPKSLPRKEVKAGPDFVLSRHLSRLLQTISSTCKSLHASFGTKTGQIVGDCFFANDAFGNIGDDDRRFL